MANLALVLGGGGSRGAYQIGVWQALRELSISYDYIAGTSVGALNGALMVQGDFEASRDLWLRIKTADVIDLAADGDALLEQGHKNSDMLRLFLTQMRKNGGADTKPLETLVRQLIDEKAIRSSKIGYSLVTVEFPSFAPIVVSKNDIPDGALADYLMASAACFPALKYHSFGGKNFIDGGYHSNLPVEIALESGASEILAVDLEAVGRVRRSKIPDGVKLRTLRSYWDLGNFLLFEPDTAKRNIALGYNDLMKEYRRFDGYAYTFAPGDIEIVAVHLGDRLFDTLKKLGLDFFDKSPFSRVFAESLKNGLRSKKNSLGSLPAITCALTEIAAEIFGCDATLVYDMTELIGSLLSEFEKLSLPPQKVFDNAFKSFEAFKNSAEALAEIDKKTVCLYLEQAVEQSVRTGSVAPTIPLSALAMPKELIAAIFFYLARQSRQVFKACDNADFMKK